MSGVLDLALEPLSEIISRLSSRECAALWLCGDKKLQWRLSKGKAIRKYVLNWWPPSKGGIWPPQIAELDGLQEFWLRCADDSPLQWFREHHLLTLNRNLKILHLSHPASLDVFQEFYLMHPKYFHHLETIHLTYRKALTGVCELKPIPPTVTSLRLDGPHKPPLCLEVSLLPNGLTKLDCRLGTLVIGNDRFPDSLKFLELRFVNSAPDVRLLHHMPDQIEEITMSCPNPMNLTIGDWTAISGLKKLRALSIPVQSSFGVEEARLIPLSLEELDLYRDDVSDNDEAECVEILKALPSTLRRLDIDGLWPSTISPIVAQNMPRLLQALYHRKVAPEAVAFLPHHLTSLDLGLLTNNSVISSFPLYLQRLILPHLPEALIEKLPNRLQSITIRREISHETASRLPHSLTHVAFPWQSNSNLRDVSVLCNSLPPALTSLRIYKTVGSPLDLIPIPSHSSLNLPRSMKILECAHLDFSASNLPEWIVGLPTGLSSLDLSLGQLQTGMMKAFGTLSSLNTLIIRLLDSPAGGWAQHFDLVSLPRTLNYLNLSNSKSPKEPSNITDDSLNGAPPGLRRLTIPHSPLLTENCLIHIPNVRSLDIQGGPTNPELERRLELVSK